MAGLLDSVCLCRVLFKRRLEAVTFNSRAKLRTYVDDCVQTDQDYDEQLLATTAGQDAALLVKALQDLGGDVSTTKSVVVASSKALARAVVQAIANETGLDIKTADHAIDLGITFSNGRGG